MDEDLVVAICGMMLFLSFPVIVGLSVTGCVAYSRTKAWDKARNQRTVSLEGRPLVESNNNSNNDNGDSDSEFDDTDDEAERTQRKAQDAADAFLTFGQKFRKEWRGVWSGKGHAELAKKNARDERRKLAKAVAKELDRRERRRARVAKTAEEADDLPPYKKA